MYFFIKLKKLIIRPRNFNLIFRKLNKSKLYTVPYLTLLFNHGMDIFNDFSKKTAPNLMSAVINYNEQSCIF